MNIATKTKKAKGSIKLTPIEKAEKIAAEYVQLQRRKDQLNAELKEHQLVQDGYREELAALLDEHPELMGDAKSLNLEAATVTLRKAPQKLVYDLERYQEDELFDVLDEFDLEEKCIETRVVPTEVIKAAQLIGSLPEALNEIGVTISEEQYSLVISPVKPAKSL